MHIPNEGSPFFVESLKKYIFTQLTVAAFAVTGIRDRLAETNR